MATIKLWLLALGRFFYELDLYRAEAKKMRREDRFNEIKEDPNAVAAERFGPAAGRVHIDTKPD
ncbi:hypothetical protein [Vibrio furnissii]|uniref:hypothetical protein n=1 Tax=Vibrio furnissii TaxID=29494 RepID=UPI001EEBBABF|nr:hypothetical protein [Vibrio furnissii]MCG6216262.1 hypothetical protein [Vibrio furnissii]